MGLECIHFTLLMLDWCHLTGNLVLASYDCDYFYSDSGVHAALVGGDCYVEVRSGAFSLSLDRNVSLNVWSLGACLMIVILHGLIN